MQVHKTKFAKSYIYRDPLVVRSIWTKEKPRPEAGSGGGVSVQRADVLRLDFRLGVILLRDL